jgi:hypothetical protein
MTDRALLEMAAKAIGIKGHFAVHAPEDGYPCYSCGITGGTVNMWNPLTDDGAALRLAVKLGLNLNHCSSEAHVFTFERKEIYAMGFCEDYSDDDKMVATRRAIVRAAAAIGEAMP